MVAPTKHSVFSNTPNNDTRGEPGVPKPHPTLENLCAVPLMSGSKVNFVTINDYW